MSENKTVFETISDQIEGLATKIGKTFEAGRLAEYDAFWDSYQNYGNRTNYIYAFAGHGWRRLKPKYPILFGKEYNDTNNTFVEFGRDATNENEWINLDDFAKTDFSQATAAVGTFNSSCFNTVRVDFNNVLQGSSCFNYARIKNLYIRLSEKCTTAYQMFTNMSYTENIIFTEDSVLNYSFDFRQSTKLTHDSLMSIINALKDGVSGLTCSLGAANLAKLTDGEKNIALSKGWVLN